MKTLASLIFLSLALATPAVAAEMSVLTPSLMPGQTLIATFTEKPAAVTFLDKTLEAFPYQTGWRVATPIPLSTKAGGYVLSATIGENVLTSVVTVKPRRFTTINLPVPPKLNQTPQQLVQNLATTNTSINSVTKNITKTTRFTQPFGLPLADNRKISSPFGEVRKTGEESITHLGTDFDVKKGTRIGAINAGTVSAAYLDPVYGNSVIIDHGYGIYSLYLHLDTMRVSKGATVKKGTFIGTVGDSGLASGPHLHLSIKVNGQSVDPIQFVSAFR